MRPLATIGRGREGAALVNSQTPVPLVTDQVIFSSSFGFKTPFFSVPASTIAALALGLDVEPCPGDRRKRLGDDYGFPRG